MKHPELSGREKWQRFLAGQDVGPMVSPLCDDWSLDIPAHWPEGVCETFPAGHKQRPLSEQIAMAAVCGYDPTFLCRVAMQPRNPDLLPTSTTEAIAGGWRTTSRVATPLGDLTCVTENKTTGHTVKDWMETADDYRRQAWLLRAQMDYDEDAAIAEGLACRAAIGDRGPMGTWSNPPAAFCNHDMGHYHLADWPEAYDELRQAARDFQFRQLSTLRKAGFDYLFYCVEATEWISPGYFLQHLMEDIRETFRLWRKLGGWILWHSCGRVAAFIEEGFYNELRPELFETLSEPPVGSLPDLAWGRERLDRDIATKGNLPLNILLQQGPQDVRRDVRRIKDQTRGYRHVVGLSDDILKNTPLANMLALVDEARKG